MKSLVTDAKEKFDSHVQQQLSAETCSIPTVTPSQPYHVPQTFAEALVNPPPHANPTLAPRGGIRARQFMLEGRRDECNPAKERTQQGTGVSQAQRQGNSLGATPETPRHPYRGGEQQHSCLIEGRRQRHCFLQCDWPRGGL